jgi:hypothetical protein
MPRPQAVRRPKTRNRSRNLVVVCLLMPVVKRVLPSDLARLSSGEIRQAEVWSR